MADKVTLELTMHRAVWVADTYTMTMDESEYASIVDELATGNKEIIDLMIDHSDGVIYGQSDVFADVRGVEESIAALTATLNTGEREYLL
jgi:uncharacterized protein with PhoU and TrkA domain